MCARPSVSTSISDGAPPESFPPPVREGRGEGAPSPTLPLTLPSPPMGRGIETPSSYLYLIGGEEWPPTLPSPPVGERD